MGVQAGACQCKFSFYDDFFMMIIGEEHDLGVFDTKEECYEAFEKRKKEFIIKLAEKTKKKDKIPECQYQAMINWEVKAKE